LGVNELLDLVSSSEFVQLEARADRKSLFSIVDRTFTETWHSMFLGWILDPLGSHGLGDYSLKRFFLLIANALLKGSESNPSLAAKIAVLGNLVDAEVLPREADQNEFSCPAGRIDVFIRIPPSNQN